METGRRFRIPLKPVVALLLVAAVAVNVPREWFVPKTEEARRAEVFSAFVALSDAPGRSDMVFMQSIASLTGQYRRASEARLAHMQQDILSLYAAAIDAEPAWLREAVGDPDFPHPFDLTAFQLDIPQFDRRGMAGPWHWGLVQTGTADIAPDAAELGWCAQWLVVWDGAGWSYGPVGSKALDAMWRAALPEVAEAALPQVEPCDLTAR